MNQRDGTDLTNDHRNMNGASVYSAKSEVHLRATDGSIAQFMNLQFSSATECFHHFLKEGGIGTTYKADSQRVVSTKLLNFIGLAMQSTI